MMSHINEDINQFYLLDHMPVGVCVLQQDLSVLYWNKCLETWTQRPKEKLIGQFIYQSYPHLFQPGYLDRLQPLFHNGQTVIFSSQVYPHFIPSVLPDGSLRLQHTIATPIPNGSNAGFYALLTLQDVTNIAPHQADQTTTQAIGDRPQVETALPASEALYRQMFAENRTVQLLLDPESGAVVDANAAAEQFYGYPLDQLRQMQITALAAFPAERISIQLAKKLLTSPGEFLLHHLLASGEQREVEIYSSPIQVKGRSLIYSIVHDITERRQAEFALALHQEQEQLLANLTNHIRRSLDLKEILQTMVNEVRKFLNADRVIIYQYHHEQQQGTIKVESHRADQSPLSNWEINPNLLQQVNQPQLLQAQATIDVVEANLDSHYKQFLEASGIQAKLTIPILQGNQIWGWLIALCDHVRRWQTWEIDLLQRLEEQLGIAVQQAEFHQQVQWLNADLEVKVAERTLQLQRSLTFEALLKRITDKVRDSLNEDQILQTVVSELGKGLGVNCCDTGIYDLTQRVSTVTHEYVTVLPRAVGHVFEFDQAIEIYQQLLQGQSAHFCRIQFDLARLDNECRFAILACPIVDNHGVLGDLWLFRRSAEQFNELEIRLVQQVANQCAIALRQSRLYQAAQAQVEELARLNQLKDDFLSTVSHELRTPLSNLKLSLRLFETLMDQDLNQSDLSKSVELSPLTVQLYHCLGVMNEECDREIDFIDNLLTLQHMEAGIHPLQPIELYLQDWLPQIVESFELMAANHHLKLHLSIPANLPPIVTDLFLLTRIFKELLTNACKFTPAGEKITIAAQALSQPTHFDQFSADVLTVPRGLHLTVTNTGIAIATTELESIFDPFYRIPSADPWKYAGTGLGLSLVKKMMIYLGGTVWAKSEADQTHFLLEFPAIQPKTSSLSNQISIER
jgi:PAS domain S-box-containing protein